MSPLASVPRTYHFAWEDLIQGGDNDFDDLTTSVSGVVCNGQPCQNFIDPNDLDDDGFCNPDGFITNDNCDDLANPDQQNSDNDPSTTTSTRPTRTASATLATRSTTPSSLRRPARGRCKRAPRSASLAADLGG